MRFDRHTASSHTSWPLLMRGAATSLTCAAGLLCAGAQAQEADDAVVPYRPTVSNPAQLTVPGRLEAELGGQRARGGGTSRDSLPYLLKLAFNPEWGVLLGGEAFIGVHDGNDNGGRARGFGDTSVAVKHAWLVDAATAFGIEAGAKLPTARQGLGSGHTDTTVNTIFSRDMAALHVDLNLNATRLGARERGSARTQIGGAAALSAQATEHWGAAAELSGTHRHGADHGNQWLTAVTYSPTKRLTVDLGIARATRPSPATTQWFAGVVFPLARLW